MEEYLVAVSEGDLDTVKRILSEGKITVNTLNHEIGERGGETALLIGMDRVYDNHNNLNYLFTYF